MSDHSVRCINFGHNKKKNWAVIYFCVCRFSVCPTMAKLNETSGVITSPFYPRRYPNNKDCTWQITANKGSRVKLEIAADMDIFQCNLCSCDFLEIQNGFNKDEAASGKLCFKPGEILTYYSTQESLKLRFFSNGANTMQNKGFKATYTFLNYTPPGKCQSLIFAIMKCCI